MNKLVTLLGLLFCLSMSAQEFEDLLFTNYEKYKVEGFSQRRTAPESVYAQLEKQNTNTLKVKEVTKSIEGKPIYW